MKNWNLNLEATTASPKLWQCLLLFFQVHIAMNSNKSAPSRLKGPSKFKESQKPTTHASYTKPKTWDSLAPERGQDACRWANVSLESCKAEYAMSAKVNREPRESAWAGGGTNATVYWPLNCTELWLLKEHSTQPQALNLRSENPRVY